MKKILSILLAIVIACSVSVTAFAATGTLNFNEKKTVTVNLDSSKIYKFKAPEQAVYVLKAKLISDCAVVYVDIFHGEYHVNGSGIYYYTDVYYDENGNEKYDKVVNDAELYFCAEKGSSFEIELYNSSEDGSYQTQKAKVELTVTKFDAKTAKVGKNTVSKNGNIFVFVPDKSGLYNFRSSATGMIDPYIEVNDINGTLSYNDDNGYENDLNFDLTVNLKKGKIYALRCETYTSDFEASEPSKGYSFKIAYNKDIKAEQISLDWYGAEDEFTLAKGDDMFYTINVVPTGALPTSKFTAVSSNEKVATVEVDDEGILYIEAKKMGKTTVTVYEANGASAEYTIVVVPKIVRIANDIIDSIRMFFMSIMYTIMGWFMFN